MDELHVEQTGYFLVPDDLYEIPKLSIYAQSVYQVLCRHANAEGKCWPGYSRISKMARCGLTSVKRGILELQQTDPPLLTVERRKKGKEKDTNVYTLRRRALRGGRSPHDLGVGRPATEGRSPGVQQGRLNEGRHNEGQPAVPAVVESAQEKRAKLEKGFEEAAAAGNLQRMVLLGMELVKGNEFANYPKEQKAAARLAERIKRLANGQEPRAFLHALVAAFKHKKETSKGEYWREAPYTPSDLETRFEGVYEHMRKRVADQQAGQENRELLERLNL